MDRQVLNDPMIDHLANEKPIFKPRIFVLLAHGYYKILMDISVGCVGHCNKKISWFLIKNMRHAQTNNIAHPFREVLIKFLPQFNGSKYILDRKVLIGD